MVKQVNANGEYFVMSGLQYSTKALNVLNAFYKTKAVIFVEGQDDILFWKEQLKKASIKECYVLEAGGMPGLIRKISQVINEDARVIIAMDRDHSDFCFKSEAHDLIVKTYGYSIENTLYCPYTVSRITNNHSRSYVCKEVDIESWYGEFCKEIKTMLVYDIANHRFQKGIAVFGDNCSRFLRSKYSDKISMERVKCFIAKIKDKFQDAELEECDGLIYKDRRLCRYLVKGHFLTNAVINFIKSKVNKTFGKRPNISLNNFYCLTIDGCNVCKETACEENNYYVTKLQTAIASI
jgi:hypothetical protein